MFSLDVFISFSFLIYPISILHKVEAATAQHCRVSGQLDRITEHRRYLPATKPGLTTGTKGLSFQDCISGLPEQVGYIGELIGDNFSETTHIGQSLNE